ncbi:hypothetical protein [Geodermatophilus sp. SYSU D01105]
MVDGSPRHPMSEESGTSIEAERVERETKADATSQTERLTRDGER